MGRPTDGLAFLYDSYACDTYAALDTRKKSQNLAILGTEKSIIPTYMKSKTLLTILLFVAMTAGARDKYNFNSDWLLNVGDTPEAFRTSFKDSGWKEVLFDLLKV